MEGPISFAVAQSQERGYWAVAAAVVVVVVVDVVVDGGGGNWLHCYVRFHDISAVVAAVVVDVDDDGILLFPI